MMSYLSCDWGTSSFRLSLVDAETFEVRESAATNQGILATSHQWNERGGTDPATRLSFYLNIINEQIVSIETKIKSSLDGTPLIISGMASSSIGMKPLPYHTLPFFLDGTGMLSELISQTPAFKHDTLLISGVCSEDDVMRGEETQLIGLPSPELTIASEQLYILPGTHSKHITVKNNQVISFKTFMTGEFFDLLSKKSILQAGLEQPGESFAGQAKAGFEKAVAEGSRSNLLHICFKVRTNSLFDKLTKKENYHYLSGLLIGAELAEIAHNDTIEIYLCCGTKLRWYYETALQVLGLTQKVHSFSADTVEKSAMVGQYKIYKKYLQR